MTLAEHLGLRVHGQLETHNGALFIPRFDRHSSNGKVIRLAQESVASLCQKAGFGLRMTHNEVCKALATVCTEPEKEITEYLKRDIANIILGNKDNHPRNTAITRTADNRICLTPLYDFAPMYLHPEGIARTTRWEKDDNGQPKWGSIIAQARDASGLPASSFLKGIKEMMVPLTTLVEEMHKLGLPADLIARTDRLTQSVLNTLREL